jgi:PAS domain S-box-containing protein
MRVSNEPILTGPLVSWDIFMQGYRRAQRLADDYSALQRMAREEQWHHSFDFEKQLFTKQATVLVTSPSLHIMFASSTIYSMTGYNSGELLGKTPHIFQGEKTSAESKQSIRLALAKNTSFDVLVTNYRKNGSLYDCHIKGYPVYNRSKQLVHYIAFEKEVSGLS